MAQTPQFKCYHNGEYLASVKNLEDAAALMAAWCGGEVRYSHKVVLWREGSEEIPAGESYDRAATIMLGRLRDYQQKAYDKVYGPSRVWANS